MTEVKQCPTMFEHDFQCGGYLGHQGPCQDHDYDGALGEHMSNIDGKDWTVIPRSPVK